MNFFRLRVLNTFLLFLIGIVAGFILKDRFYPAAPQPHPAAYKAGQEPAAADEPDPAAEEEAPPAEDEEEPAPRESRAPAVSAGTLDEPAPDNGGNHLVIEPAPAPAAKRGEVLRGAKEEFFRKPADYAGRELEMDLQLITAKRSPEGWRLNFVYTAPDKRVDYLYADAAPGLLGESPDLRIGYVYTARFFCGKGDTGSGNALTAFSSTGQKADWATGLSAVE